MAIDRAKLRQIILQEIRQLNEEAQDLPMIAKQRNAVERTAKILTDVVVNIIRSMENVNELYEDFPVLGTVDQLIEDLVDLVVGREGVIDTEYDTFFRKTRRLAAGVRVYTSKEWQLMLAQNLRDLALTLIDAKVIKTGRYTQDDVIKVRDAIYSEIGVETERLIQDELAKLDMQADKTLRKTFLDLGIID